MLLLLLKLENVYIGEGINAVKRQRGFIVVTLYVDVKDNIIDRRFLYSICYLLKEKKTAYRMA